MSLWRVFFLYAVRPAAIMGVCFILPLAFGYRFYWPTCVSTVAAFVLTAYLYEVKTEVEVRTLDEWFPVSTAPTGQFLLVDLSIIPGTLPAIAKLEDGAWITPSRQALTWAPNVWRALPEKQRADPPRGS